MEETTEKVTKQEFDMGCAASSDTGTEYVSLGNHGHRNVSKKPITPTDTQLYGKDHNKRRKSSSSSSSSSSSDDEKSKKSKEENNVPPLPPPTLTTTNQQTEDRQKPHLPPIVPIPPKEEQKEDKQPSPLPPQQQEDKEPILPPSAPQEDKQPTPTPPQEDKQPTPTPPPPQEDTQPTPAPPTPQEDKQPTPCPPPPQEDKQPSPCPPPPQEDKQPTPSPPIPQEDKQSTPAPGPEQNEQEDLNNRDERPPPPVTNDEVVERHPPHTTGDEVTERCHTSSVAGYKSTVVGTHERFVNQQAISNPKRPSPNDGKYYTDRDFTLRDAFPRRRDFEWKRPQEFCDNPALFTDGATRFDIGQGEVGTCWFLSMVANIADSPELLKRVVPESEYYIGTDKYDGVFHCKFWRFGDWNDVYIDDCLPVKGGRYLVGAHSDTDNNEMWVALLEKAFAKLYGNYEEVTGGQTGDAFMNLTGGVGETVNFEKMKMSPSQLHRRLQNSFKSPTTMVGCVCPGRSNDKYGLVGGHAYSVNGTYKVGSNLLVRLRNPWGKTEWTGAWGDGSREMQTQGSSIPHPNKDDGEFYMHIDDFLQYFEQVTICNITPDVDRDGHADTLNYITTIFSKWERGKAGGFQNKMENPKFTITVGDEGADENGDVPIVLQIVQKTTDRQDDKIGIRCDLYKVLNEDANMIVLDELGDKNNLYRIDMSTSARYRVKPGKYLALPSTMNSDSEDKRVLKEFLVRFFTYGPIQGPEEVKDKIILAGKGPEITIKNKSGEVVETISLENGFSQCFPGRFNRGSNSGGQVGCGESFAKNPQFLINIEMPQRFKVEVMQPGCKEEFPIGIKLFAANGNNIPVDYTFLNKNYASAIRDLNGDDGAFSYGQCVESGYELQAGTYILVVHANTEKDENTFAVALYSERSPFGVESVNLH